MNGQFHFVTSTGTPVMAQGPDQFHLAWVTPIVLDRHDHFPMWIESTWMDSDGTIYGWYHHEPGNVCRGSNLTAPQIGAVVSHDGGATYSDLGIVLTSGDPVDCSAKNGFFAGGNGDFSVIADTEQSYFYFLFTSYGGDLSQQGIAMARMPFEDRHNPVGTVWKYFAGNWTEPGVGGRLTPIFPARVSWQRSDTDSYWGPAIHWNTHVESYVVLLNHACCKPNWPQEGIYASFNADLSQPINWSAPERILRDIGYAPGYYPQVMGLGFGETDTFAGETARLYVHGRSKWEIQFRKLDQTDEGSTEPTDPLPGPIDQSVPEPMGRRPYR
jgi:hypothetical protein